MDLHLKRNFDQLRSEMVEKAIFARGVRSELVLNAMRSVPREDFLPKQLREFAYEDAPLPIEEGQTISQPYIVAFMTEALALHGGERVLEIGAGSGYAAAVLSKIAGEVYTVERIGQLAEKAASKLADLGYHNVHVLHGDGTKGWPEHAPYDGVIVAAGGPSVPESLKEQLKIGGRLIIPLGRDPKVQELVRITRISENEYAREDLADVRFVPLIGQEGWAPAERERTRPRPARPFTSLAKDTLAQKIANGCEPFESIEAAPLDRLLARIGEARVVLLGEASHGTSEFYRMRDRISRELIAKKGFRFVAIEGDWPDAARVDHYVRHMEYPPSEWTAFARFPTWMWRNNEVRAFVDWLRAHNAPLKAADRAAFHGLDLYSLYDSIRAVLKYLDEIDPSTAAVARERYGCLTPWQSDPATYGHASLTGYAIGFGTNSGTVAAASNWDGPMEIKTVLPAISESYERCCHDSGITSFYLDLRQLNSFGLESLRKPRLERAIGVIYRPETELASHYFQAILPEQFDEYIWFDETKAVAPFETKTLEEMPDTYPFGL